MAPALSAVRLINFFVYRGSAGLLHAAQADRRWVDKAEL
jgi:hypothetical protein